MDKVRIGIIGFGNMGSAHATCIHNHEIPGLLLTAICDISPQKRRKAHELFKDVKIFETYEELLSSNTTDAVLIATPHYLHPIIGVKAFEANQNVLTEKPIAVSVSEGMKLCKAASDSNKVFCIMFNQRTYPLYKRAKEMIESGALGEIKRVIWIITNWYRTQAYYDSGDWRATWALEGGGVLLNQAPHNLDLIQWICGMPCKMQAYCKEGRYHKIEVEDDVTMYGEFSNGATFSFLTSTGEYPGTNRLEISGNRGKIVLEYGKLKWWENEISEREYCYHEERYDELPKISYKEYSEDFVESGHKEILKNFTNAILHGEPLIAKGEDGINELMLSNAAYLSSWTNSMVELPFNVDLFDAILKDKIKHTMGNASRKSQKNDHMASDYKTKWQVNW